MIVIRCEKKRAEIVGWLLEEKERRIKRPRNVPNTYPSILDGFLSVRGRRVKRTRSNRLTPQHEEIALGRHYRHQVARNFLFV